LAIGTKPCNECKNTKEIRKILIKLALNFYVPEELFDLISAYWLNSKMKNKIRQKQNFIFKWFCPIKKNISVN
jgi:hypothetical protein